MGAKAAWNGQRSVGGKGGDKPGPVFALGRFGFAFGRGVAVLGVRSGLPIGKAGKEPGGDGGAMEPFSEHGTPLSV